MAEAFGEPVAGRGGWDARSRRRAASGIR